VLPNDKGTLPIDRGLEIIGFRLVEDTLDDSFNLFGLVLAHESSRSEFHRREHCLILINNILTN